MSLNSSSGSRQAKKELLNKINELYSQAMALDKKYNNYKKKNDVINFWIKTKTNTEGNHVQKNKLSRNMKLIENKRNYIDKKITSLKEILISKQTKYNQKIASQKQKRIRTILPKSQMTKNLENTKPTLNSIERIKTPSHPNNKTVNQIKKNLLLKSKPKPKKINKKLTPLFTINNN
jgi:hypothetical protein